ncbi:MAG: hypothetical protein GXO60_04425 [Epsilonproteobacteria bacterium]|nr:hypothetical protein [Campylobacterota bacterium]
MRKIVSTMILGLYLTTTNIQADTKIEPIKQQQSIVINLAGKQRMLTQKMSKEALLIARGINVKENKKNLNQSIALFDKTIKGLINGDKELKLPKTTDKEIIKQLDLVMKLWSSFKQDVEKVASGDIKKSTLEAIDKKNLPLLDNMNIVVEMYEEKSKSQLDPQIAKTINLAGRQRMLTQKMTKELLLIANSLKSDENEKSLKSTGELFKDTLTNLMINNKNAMNDPEIAKRLSNVKNLWDKYQYIIANTDLSPKGQKESQQKQNDISKQITKELLTIAHRVDSKAYTQNLKKTGELFDKTLTALIDGNADLGLAGTKDKKILAQLEKVKKLWNQYKVVIENADISDSGLQKAMDINIPLLQSMNQAVTLYEKRAK